MEQGSDEGSPFDGMSWGIVVTVVLMLAVLVGSLLWRPQLPEGPPMETLPVPGITAPADDADD